jgi:integrase/recombinase XerD
VVKLKVKDLQMRPGVLHFKILGKRDKIRYLPVNAEALRPIDEYLELSRHASDKGGALFRPVKNNTTGTLKKHLHPDSLYQCGGLCRSGWA